jgi:ribosomal protein S18 acetylase RimI-like enzyme
MTNPGNAARSTTAVAADGVTFRRWGGLEDVDGMAAANGRLRSGIGLLEAIDVEGMRHRYTHFVNSDPATDCILAEHHGRTAGYARVEWHDLAAGDRMYDATVVVEPAVWGLGVAETFVRWSETRAQAMAVEHPTGRAEHVDHYAFQGDTELAAALEGLGYTAVRWDAEMLRPTMDDLPPVVIPDGYVLRAPETGELEAVHEMTVAAFREHWGEWAAADQRIESWVGDPRFRLDLVVVAFAGSEPVAMVSNFVEVSPDGSVRGLLDVAATHPGHRRRGLSRAAIGRSLELLRAQGATSAYLGVDTDNQNRAQAFYASCGFQTVTVSTSYRKALARSEGTR